MNHLQIEQDSSDPHGLADFQAVGEEGEAWGALVIGWQDLNVNCSDRAPKRKKIEDQFTVLTTCWVFWRWIVDKKMNQEFFCHIIWSEIIIVAILQKCHEGLGAWYWTS